MRKESDVFTRAVDLLNVIVICGLVAWLLVFLAI
jgi:hypothetical protein